MIGKTDGVIREDFRFPYHFAETFEAAVQMMIALVLGELVKGAVMAELPVRDTVCVAPDGAAEMRVVFQPSIFIFETDENVSHFAVTIRHAKAAQGGTERVDGRGDSGWVGQRDGF